MGAFLRTGAVSLRRDEQGWVCEECAARHDVLVEEALTELVSDVAADVEAVEIASLIEVARLGALSWAPIGTVGFDPEMAPPRAGSLLSLLCC